MNGLDLLSAVSHIDIENLGLNINGSRYELKEMSLNNIMELNTRIFKGISYTDGEWILVFENEAVATKTEEKPKRTKRTKPEPVKEVVAIMNPPEPIEEISVTEEEEDVFDLFA